MKWDKELHLEQAEAEIKRAFDASLLHPKKGWIHYIRQALGMSTRQLGERLGLSQPRISALEKAEVDQSVTLNSLERAANALGCHVVYAFVLNNPEDSLSAQRKAQARKKAEFISKRSAQHMLLEDQATEDGHQRKKSEALAQEYLRNWPRDFWDNQ